MKVRSYRGTAAAARRHATINVVDFSDVRRCRNMVDVSDVTTQNICTQIKM